MKTTLNLKDIWVAYASFSPGVRSVTNEKDSRHFISGELITFVAKHPRLTRYNVYVSMFFNVLQTFAYFLLWYGFYIFAFSMGFYIMLHKVCFESRFGRASFNV